MPSMRLRWADSPCAIRSRAPMSAPRRRAWCAHEHDARRAAAGIVTVLSSVSAFRVLVRGSARAW